MNIEKLPLTKKALERGRIELLRDPIEVEVDEPDDYEANIASAKSTLSEEQLKAFDGLLEFLESPDDSLAVVIGYAGTGKTYMVSRLISTVRGKVALSAPTNKAVKVLREQQSFGGDVDYSTIHKLLALKMKWIYPRQGQNFKPYQVLTSVWNKSPMISSYKLLIVDEVSMLTNELFDMIGKHKDKCKVVFLGDPAQIPPVKEEDSQPLLEKGRTLHNIKLFNLSTIMRQKADNSILLTAHQVRDNRFTEGEVILDRLSNKDVLFFGGAYREDIEAFITVMLKHFSSMAFKEDSDYCKTLAWTNKTVDHYNELIRTKLFGKDLKYLMIGEKLIADTPVIDDDVILFNTSDEFEVLEYEEMEDVFEVPTQKEQNKKQQIILEGMNLETNASTITVKYYSTRVLYRLGKGEVVRALIRILNPESQKQLSWVTSKIFKSKHWLPGWQDSYKYWTERYAKVKYNYAITCHKAQGSTYENVFLIEDDIRKNPKALERNRILYTAITRPSDRLFILSNKNDSLLEQRIQ